MQSGSLRKLTAARQPVHLTLVVFLNFKEMEHNISTLLIGLSVQIRRSDGRVHAAIVKSVDGVKSTAMVEWHIGHQTQMKEIELGDIYNLNPKLLDSLLENLNVIDKEPPPPQEKKYETRLRSSRIPAPGSFATRSQARQTCLFQNSVKESSLSQQEVVGPDLPSSSVLTNSDVPNQQCRRNDAKTSQVVPLRSEPTSENDEPDRMPPPSLLMTSRRKTLAQQEVSKSSKRLSSVMKPPETQTKRTKYGDVSRPNNKFYEMIQEFRETLEINHLSVADVVRWMVFYFKCRKLLYH